MVEHLFTCELFALPDLQRLPLSNTSSLSPLLHLGSPSLPLSSSQTRLLWSYRKPITAILFSFMGVSTPRIDSTTMYWVCYMSGTVPSWWNTLGNKTDPNSLPSWNWPVRVDAFLSPFASVNWPQPWRSSSDSTFLCKIRPQVLSFCPVTYRLLYKNSCYLSSVQYV